MRLSAERLRLLLPALALVAILAAIFALQPRAISYFGLNLMLNLSLPIVLATLAQMFVIAATTSTSASARSSASSAASAAAGSATQPPLGVALLAACVLAYAALGALIHLRNLPSIVVTLGASFVWHGLAMLLLPTPGGRAPDWLQAADALAAALRAAADPGRRRGGPARRSPA